MSEERGDSAEAEGPRQTDGAGRPAVGGASPASPALSKRALRFLKRLRSPDRLIALLEQGLLAGLRLAAVVVFVRLMAAESFGAFALVVSIAFILNNAQRSLVILPFILSCQRYENRHQVANDWWWIDLAIAAIVGGLLMAVWALSRALGVPDWVQTSLLFSAVSAPPLMLYTFMRRWSYQFGAYRGILWMLIAHILGYGAGIAAAVLEPQVTALPFLAFAAGPLAGSLVGLLMSLRALRWPSRNLLAMWRKSFGFTGWSFLSFLCGTVYTNGMNVLAAVMLGPIASGTFMATRTIVAPVISITGAVDMIDKPRAGRAYAAGGHAKLRSAIRSTLATLLLLALPYLIAVSVFSGEALELAYGDRYAGLELEVRLWALGMLLQLAANPLATHLVTLADSRGIFLSSFVAAIVTVAVALPLFEEAGLAAALIGMICGRLTNVVMLFVATRRTPADDPMPLQDGTARAGDTI